MGIVYRAYDPHLGRTVAIKTISLSGPEFLEDEQYRPRFLREARAAGRLSHPGIVTVFDVGEDAESGEPYLVMEHVSGEPLSRVLGRNRKLPLSQALQFAEEIAQALDYAHNQGVIHRDIKPSNILITDAGHAKIADFGVAWLNREMSQIGEVVGSPAYMAPEQMAGKQADARSDLFSLGVVLYTMLTGFRPFQGNSAKTVCFKVMNIEPVPVTSFQSEILPELDAIVSRAIAKDPDERFSSGAELANALESFSRHVRRVAIFKVAAFARSTANSSEAGLQTIAGDEFIAGASFGRPAKAGAASSTTAQSKAGPVGINQTCCGGAASQGAG
jgi:eukaryotic-like serine/threonine-protein kinase